MLFSPTHDERKLPVHTLLEPDLLNTSGHTASFKTDECCLCLLRFEFLFYLLLMLSIETGDQGRYRRWKVINIARIVKSPNDPVVRVLYKSNRGLPSFDFFKYICAENISPLFIYSCFTFNQCQTTRMRKLA